MEKVKSIFATFIVVCALGGCSSSTIGESLNFQKVNEFYGNCMAVETEVAIEATTKEENLSYKLLYKKDATEEKIEVVEPESISGISIPMENGNVLLDDKQLSVTSAIELSSNLTPINVIPQVISCLATIIPTDIGTENLDDVKMSVFTYEMKIDGVAYSQRVWLDNSTMLPKKAQVFLDDACIMECVFNTFEWDSSLKN